MKVLFAMGSEQKSKNVAEKYYEKYGEEIEYKNVFYFKALLDEIKKNKTYDRIVINEDLEQFFVKNVEALDKFIFNNIDLLTDEIENSEIIFICSDRRTKQNDRFVERLFNIGVYNTLIGDERNVTALCDYIKNPMNKKEAKRHLNINPVVSNGSVSTSDDTVEEVQIMNILKYYDNIKGKTEEYVPAFDRIAEQYSRNQLKIIAYYLPNDVKNVIFESERYMYLAEGNQVSAQNSSKTTKTISNKPPRKGLFGILKENKNKENTRSQPDVVVEPRAQEQEILKAERDELEREHAEAVAKAKREALEREQAEAQAKADFERQQAEAKLKAEQEAIERQQAELKARAEQEAKERQQAELKLRAEQEAIERQQAELKARAEREAKEREQAELKARAEQEVISKSAYTINTGNSEPVVVVETAVPNREKQSEDESNDIQIEVMPSVENVVRNSEAKLQSDELQFSSNDWFEKKQAELRASINQDSSMKQQEDVREQTELKARAEQEAKAREQAELKAKAEQEAKAREQAELKAKAEQEAKAREQAELKARAEQEALAKQQAELKAKAEQEAREREQAELRLKAEQEVLARQQAEMKAKAEQDEKKRAEQERFENERRKLEQEKLALEEERRKLMEKSAQLTTNVPRPDYGADAPIKMDYKKMVVFVGANKSGTTFMVNAISHKLASSKVGVGVLDMSRDKSLYYIFNQDDKDLRKIAVECMQRLSEGIDSYIPAERNLKIYTSVPGPSADSRRAYKNRAIIDTVKNANNLVIVDADFSTPLEYYEKADEIYIIQDLDIIKMQETTLFLRELKNRSIDMNKIKVIINKYVKSLLTPKKLIQGLSYYNDPQMSFIDELLGSKVQHFLVPFNVENYAKYIDGVYNNKLDYKKYSPDFLSSIDEISSCVYRRNVPAKKRGLFR